MTSNIFGQAHFRGDPTEALRRMLAGPKLAKETWASSTLFPVENAWRLLTIDENFMLAHPTFWAKVFATAERSKPHLAAFDGMSIAISPFMGTEVRDLDPHSSDSAETAAAKIKERQRVVMAIAAATFGAEGKAPK